MHLKSELSLFKSTLALNAVSEPNIPKLFPKLNNPNVSRLFSRNSPLRLTHIPTHPIGRLSILTPKITRKNNISMVFRYIRRRRRSERIISMGQQPKPPKRRHTNHQHKIYWGICFRGGSTEYLVRLTDLVFWVFYV